MLIGPNPEVDMPRFPTPWWYDAAYDAVKDATGWTVFELSEPENPELLHLVVAAVNEKYGKLPEAEPQSKTYERASDIPEYVKAFRDASGSEAVRIASGSEVVRIGDGGWWFVAYQGNISDLDVEAYQDGDVEGHNASSAVAPLTPIPFPDYLR